VVVQHDVPSLDLECVCPARGSRDSHSAGLPTLQGGTQVAVGPTGGLKHESGVHCDGLMSLEKTRPTDFVGELGADKLRELDAALAVALGLQTRSRSTI
jgi:mRNA-degrading endonuclease toxin of MazEF toxin-antitoxin module